MSVRRLAADQPEGFAFTPENLEWAHAQIKKYPEGRQASAVLPILWRAQEQMGGWLPEPALRYVADMLGLAYIRIYGPEAPAFDGSWKPGDLEQMP